MLMQILVTICCVCTKSSLSNAQTKKKQTKENDRLRISMEFYVFEGVTKEMEFKWKFGNSSEVGNFI